MSKKTNYFHSHIFLVFFGEGRDVRFESYFTCERPKFSELPGCTSQMVLLYHFGRVTICHGYLLLKKEHTSDIDTNVFF